MWFLILIPILAFVYWDAVIFAIKYVAISCKYLVWPGKELPLKERFGSWALVTGCTEGLGKAYAAELAKRGISIVMVSLYQHELDAVSKEFETEYNVETRTICVDLTGGKEALDKVVRELGDIPVGILVNNVGAAPKHPDYLANIPEADLWAVLQLNIIAMTMLTRRLLPQMVQRRQGAVVNVASGSEMQPMAFFNVYAASKMYVKSFSTAIRMEYAEHNITVHRISPFYVRTSMTKHMQHWSSSSWLTPDPEAFARHAITALGRQDHTAGYWPHRLLYFTLSLLPVWFLSFLSYRMAIKSRNQAVQTVLKA